MYQIVNTHLNILVFMKVTPLKHISIAIILTALYNTLNAKITFFLAAFPKLKLHGLNRAVCYRG